MIAIFPPAVLEFFDLRWERGINENIPRLLREIAESGQTGLTLVRAIEVSAERDYGPLTPELKYLVAQISWGTSLDDALRAFAKRANTKLAQRTADLIAEVARSGGDTKEIMEQLNRHIWELESIDRERYAQMRPYAVVVYIAFGVFLFTDIMLIHSFFAQIVRPTVEGHAERWGRRKHFRRDVWRGRKSTQAGTLSCNSGSGLSGRPNCRKDERSKSGRGFETCSSLAHPHFRLILHIRVG